MEVEEGVPSGTSWPPAQSLFPDRGLLESGAKQAAGSSPSQVSNPSQKPTDFGAGNPAPPQLVRSREEVTQQRARELDEEALLRPPGKSWWSGLHGTSITLRWVPKAGVGGV